MSTNSVKYPIEVVDKFSIPMQDFINNVDSAQQKMAKFSDAMEKLWNGAKIIASIGIVFKKAFDFGKESVNASNQIEVYEASLKNMLGTADAARERMQDYMRIAQATPFDLPQVVEAGNKLQAVGKYSEENLKMLGDLAAVSGKPMEQALNAYTKMASGQKGVAIDMFRDLMITTEDWTKATGKGVDKSGQLQASTKELLAALPQIMKSKGYLGMMASQAETTQGKLANLEDGIFQLKAAIGEQLRPTVLNFTSSASRAVDAMKRWVEIPLEQKIAAEKQELNFLVEQLLDTNTKEDERATVIDTLQRKYPEFLKNLNLEKSTNEEIATALQKANDEYDRKMKNAAINRKIEQLQAEQGETMDDIMAYKASIDGKKKYSTLVLKQKEITDRVFGKDEFGHYELDDEGHLFHYYMKGRTSYRDEKKDWEKDIPEETVKELLKIHDEMVIAKEAMTFLGNDEKRLKKAEKAYEKYKNTIKFWEDMLEPENKPDDNGNNGNGGSSAASALEDASTTISAGGKSVKNFNITINDGLVKEVVNNFNSSDDDPASASLFMEKLSDALQTIVNDVNYAAN
jgi:hypothetical protein